MPARPTVALQAWLIRDDRPIGDPLTPTTFSQQLDLSNAIPLNGELALRWRNNMDFLIRVDVRSAEQNPTVLQGQFEARGEREFDPNLVWIAPAMVFGIGNESKITRVDSNKHTRHGTMGSVHQEIERVMKSRKRHRSFYIRIPSTGECIEFSNGATLLDRKGLQIRRFITDAQAEWLTVLKALCANRGLRLKVLPLQENESVALLDVYGEPVVVTEHVKAIFREAFGLNESAVVEFTALIDWFFGIVPRRAFAIPVFSKHLWRQPLGIMTRPRESRN